MALYKGLIVAYVFVYVYVSVGLLCFGGQKLVRIAAFYSHCRPLTCYLEKQLDLRHLIFTLPVPSVFNCIIAPLYNQGYLLAVLYCNSSSSHPPVLVIDTSSIYSLCFCFEEYQAKEKGISNDSRR